MISLVCICLQVRVWRIIRKVLCLPVALHGGRMVYTRRGPGLVHICEGFLLHQVSSCSECLLIVRCLPGLLGQQLHGSGGVQNIHAIQTPWGQCGTVVGAGTGVSRQLRGLGCMFMKILGPRYVFVYWA